MHATSVRWETLSIVILNIIGMHAYNYVYVHVYMLYVCTCVVCLVLNT